MRLRTPLSVALAVATFVTVGSGHAASDCPGDAVTELPYTDSGSFPAGVDDLDPEGLDFSACGYPDPIAANGLDFVVVFPVGASTADIDCTLQATGSVLMIYGLGEACDHPGGVTAWAEQACIDVQVGSSISWHMGFFGAASVVVDALGNPSAQFTLNCDGTLPVELLSVGVE